MTHVRFDYSKALTFFNEHELTYLRDFVKPHTIISMKNRRGQRFSRLGGPPEHYDKEEFARIKKRGKNQV